MRAAIENAVSIRTLANEIRQSRIDTAARGQSLWRLLFRLTLCAEQAMQTTLTRLTIAAEGILASQSVERQTAPR